MTLAQALEALCFDHGSTAEVLCGLDVARPRHDRAGEFLDGGFASAAAAGVVGELQRACADRPELQDDRRGAAGSDRAQPVAAAGRAGAREGNPHVVERTVHQIGRHPANAVVLYVALAGEAFFYHADGIEVLRPGQAVLCDADAPFVRGFARGLTELVLKVPRTVFEVLSEGASVRGPRVFTIAGSPGANEPGYALGRLMHSALHGGPEQDRPRLEQDVLGLLRAMVAGTRAGDTRARLHAAQSFVLRNLTDRSLSAARIATAVGISERQLTRVFSELGGVARWITDRRLDLARERLASGTRGSVREVFWECGFSSQSYFARAFKERFSETPVDVLRAARHS